MNFYRTLVTTALILTVFNPSARAGVFNLPQFVEYENWAVGLEPELTLSSGSGMAANLKFTYGISPLSNLQVGIGGGSGSRQFRFGATYTFDFIPDLDNQIGAGLGLSAYLYNLKNSGSQFETSILPYIHNSFKTEGRLELDPFVALPMGLEFNDGNYRSFFQLVLGSNFVATEHLSYTFELGLNLKDTDTYFAGGITYRN